MKYIIDLDKLKGPELRLYKNVEYILKSEQDVFISSQSDQIKLYPKCLGNGTPEVFIDVNLEVMGDETWLFIDDRQIPVRFLYDEFVLANQLEDITPAYINEEYPLFKKLLEYYFKYTGMEFKPSSFIHNMEKYADIDETFDEFREYIYSEVLHYLPKDVKASKVILSKYILQFYNLRGTPDSILFLLYIIFGEEAKLTLGRDKILIASNKEQGLLSDKNIVLQDNYKYMLFSYIINLRSAKFYQYKDVLQNLTGPSGSLAFGLKQNVINNINIVVTEMPFTVRHERG